MNRPWFTWRYVALAGWLSCDVEISKFMQAARSHSRSWPATVNCPTAAHLGPSATTGIADPCLHDDADLNAGVTGYELFISQRQLSTLRGSLPPYNSNRIASFYHSLHRNSPRDALEEKPPKLLSCRPIRLRDGDGRWLTMREGRPAKAPSTTRSGSAGVRRAWPPA